MSIFAKKLDSDQRPLGDGPLPLSPPPATTPRGYGIAETIQLMRTLPVEQNVELVVKVVRATLASLHVHLPDIIEDASKKQKSIQERIASVHGQIADLEKQLDAHRRDIAAMEADLKETSNVKERLQMAEKSGLGGHPTPPFGASSQPPPTPPGARLPPGSKTPEETTQKD
jgi:hypothetical protein